MRGDFKKYESENAPGAPELEIPTSSRGPGSHLQSVLLKQKGALSAPPHGAGVIVFTPDPKAPRSLEIQTQTFIQV